MNARRQPADRPRPGLRRLIQPLVAPHVFDFWASRINRSWSWERPLARIVQRRQASADAVTLVLQLNRHWEGFRAGQHVNVGVEIDGVRLTRSYSPSRVPGTDRRIEITVKAIDGGRVSRYLCHEARIGEVLELSQAFGDMTLSASSRGGRLFLAAGSGITPLMAMVRELAEQGMRQPLTLAYWARTRDELCFADELRALAAAHANFDVRFALTRESTLRDGETADRISADALQSLVEDLPQRQVFACGPGGFVATARALLSASAQSFQAEAFTPPPRPVDAGDLAQGSVEVTLARSGRTLTVARGQSLLSAFEAEGLRPASGCRMGICNTCACAKRSGQTRHLHTGELAGEPVSALKLCVSSAASDLVLDL